MFILLLAPEAANDGNEVNDDALFVVLVVSVESFGRNPPRNEEVLFDDDDDDDDADEANGFQRFEESSFVPPPSPPPKVRIPLENVEEHSTTCWGKTTLSLLFRAKRGGVSASSLLRMFFLLCVTTFKSSLLFSPTTWEI
jgi:hypothetical protein